MPYGYTDIKTRSAVLALFIPSGADMFNKIFYFNASNANDFTGKLITEMRAITPTEMTRYNGFSIFNPADATNNFYITLNDMNNESLFVDYSLSSMTRYTGGDEKAVNQFNCIINWNRSYLKTFNAISSAGAYVCLEITYKV